MSPINFIFFLQSNDKKTDFCSSPALKQFTIHYSIDENAENVRPTVVHPAVTFRFSILMLLNYKRACRLLTFCNIVLDSGSREF